MQALVFQQSRVRGLQAMLVLGIHREDDIGPADIRRADGASCVRAGTGRQRVEAGPPSPHGFGGRAAQLVAAADEQQVDHSCSCSWRALRTG